MVEEETTATMRWTKSFLRLMLVGISCGFAACGGSNSGASPRSPSPSPADAIYYDANVETMNNAQPTAQAVAIKGTQMVAVGSNSAVLAYKGVNTKVSDLQGATILPGFIDAHSHLMAYAFFSDTKHWTDLSSVNLYFKPLPGDPRCANPTDPQQCFIPVQTEDDVTTRIANQVVAARASGFNAVYAVNYDPARLGHSAECSGPSTNVGFQCPNLEDGTPGRDRV